MIVVLLLLMSLEVQAQPTAGDGNSDSNCQSIKSEEGMTMTIKLMNTAPRQSMCTNETDTARDM